MQTQKPSTKQRIKTSAIELFNQNDTFSISTNHIARHINMSPGNLYYHYKNKEAIIREIYQDVSDIFESYHFFEKILISNNPIKEFLSMHDIYAELFLEYKFLMRDLPVLMAIDPKLKVMYSQKQKKRILQIEGILKYLISQKIIEGIALADVTTRAKLHWFITAYWQVFSATTDDVSAESILEAKKVIFTMHIYPFLTEKGRKMLDEFQEKKEQ